MRQKGQPLLRSYDRSEAKNLSGDTMGTGSFVRFPSRPSEAGDRLRSNVVSHDRLRSNVVHERQVSASKMTLGQNVDTPRKAACSCIYLYLEVFVHSFDPH